MRVGVQLHSLVQGDLVVPAPFVEETIFCPLNVLRTLVKNQWTMRDFPGGPVVKNLCFQGKGHGFDPWSGNEDPTCCESWPKNKKQTNKKIN